MMKKPSSTVALRLIKNKIECFYLCTKREKTLDHMDMPLSLIVSRNEKYPNQFFNRGLHFNRKCTVFDIDLDISARYFEARIFIDYSLLKKESFSMAPFIFSFS